MLAVSLASLAIGSANTIPQPEPVNLLGRKVPLQTLISQLILSNTLLKLWQKHVMRTIFDKIVKKLLHVYIFLGFILII